MASWFSPRRRKSAEATGGQQGKQRQQQQHQHKEHPEQEQQEKQQHIGEAGKVSRSSSRVGALLSPRASGKLGRSGSSVKIVKSSSMLALQLPRNSSTKRIPEQTKKSAEQWRAELSRDEFRVLRMNGMEPPFSGKYLDRPQVHGIYICRACKNPVLSTHAQQEASKQAWAVFKDILPGGSKVQIVQRGCEDAEHLMCCGCNSFLGMMSPDSDELLINSLAVQFHRVTKEQHKLLLRGKDPGDI